MRQKFEAGAMLKYTKRKFDTKMCSLNRSAYASIYVTHKDFIFNIWHLILHDNCSKNDMLIDIT